MHVSIHGSFTFILTSINRFSMSPDKWLKILFDFSKEISMLILKILPMEMNESLLVCCPLLPVCTCPPTPPPIPGPLPAILILFFGSISIKFGILSNHLDLALLQKQTEATWGPWFLLIYILSVPRVRGCQRWWQPVKPSMGQPLSTSAVFFYLSTCQYLLF